MKLTQAEGITPRLGLKFGFCSEIPRHWFEGDAFKTRLFDADSVITPCAERFFINCVREYLPSITDLKLADQARAFIQQEGQHSRQHIEANRRLVLQGIDVTAIEQRCDRADRLIRSFTPKSFALSLTSACEYLTAVTAKAFLDNPEHMAGTDQRIFGLLAWHAAEEFEHKSVCFDVMTKVAGVGYFQRILGMLVGMPIFAFRLARTINTMLEADGLSFVQRAKCMLRGFAWMHSADGLTRLEHRDFFAYFRPGFHPSELDGFDKGYKRWMSAFDRTGDPVAAGEAFRLAA